MARNQLSSYNAGNWAVSSAVRASGLHLVARHHTEQLQPIRSTKSGHRIVRSCSFSFAFVPRSRTIVRVGTTPTTNRIYLGAGA
jgi:hypothetical protein